MIENGLQRKQKKNEEWENLKKVNFMNLEETFLCDQTGFFILNVTILPILGP